MDKPRRRVWWDEYASREFESLDPESTIAILPIAAIEQHGPHLPVGVDAAINRGMLETLIDRLPVDLDIRILPIQQVGKSNEHLRMPGTLTLSAATLIEAWTELGLSVARAGVRKLVIVNSHGGNDEVMGIVARELRVRADMLVVKSAWSRLGKPAGLYSERELKFGIHGGDFETSLMLHFRPELVEMARAQDFRSVAEDDEVATLKARNGPLHVRRIVEFERTAGGVERDRLVRRHRTMDRVGIVVLNDQRARSAQVGHVELRCADAREPIDLGRA